MSSFTKRKPGGLVLNCTLFLIAFVVSLLGAEWIFRAYERVRFSTAYVDEHGVVNLRALNYNDMTVLVAKPADEWRVLSLGDSFAYSIMVYDYSYSGVVARLVNTANTERQVRIVNLGEPSTSVNDYRAAYQYWAAILHPDAAIFNIFLGNDILDIAFKYIPPQWTLNRVYAEKDFNITDGSARSHIPHRFPLRLFDYAYAYSLAFFCKPQPVQEVSLPDSRYNVAADSAFNGLPEELYFVANRGQLANFDFSQLETLSTGYAAVYDFVRFVSDLRQQGTKVLITLAPSESQADPALRAQLEVRYHIDLTPYDWRLSARIISAIATQVDARVPVLDLTGYFQCRAEAGEQLYYPRNTHWNLEGNALAGQVIASFILQNWFSAPAIVPESLRSCVAAKERLEPKTSAAAIDAFITKTLQPTIRRIVEQSGRQSQENIHILMEPGK